MPEKKNFVLRLDHATYKTLEKWASDEFRSVNGQIEFILHSALKNQFGQHYQEKFRMQTDTAGSGSLADDHVDPPESP